MARVCGIGLSEIFKPPSNSNNEVDSIIVRRNCDNDQVFDLQCLQVNSGSPSMRPLPEEL